MEKIGVVHQAAFAFIGNGPPHSLNWATVLQQALKRVGREWDGVLGPESFALREYCHPPISDDEMYECASRSYGTHPRTLVMQQRNRSCIIIDFSGDNILGSGRLLVTYDPA
jgi:hypothetical protein